MAINAILSHSSMPWVRGASAPAPHGSFEVISSLAAVVAVFAVVGPFLLGDRDAAQSVMQTAPADKAAARSAQTATTGGRSIPAAPTAEYMVAGYGGTPYTYPSDVKIVKPGQHDYTVKGVNWEGKAFENPIFYGVRVLRWFEGGSTGAMLDFTHSKAYARLSEDREFSGTINGAPAPARAKLKDLFHRLEASHGHNMLTLNGLFRLPDFGIKLLPYVGAGAGVALPHSEVEQVSDPRRTYEYQYTGPVAQALVGLEFRLAKISYFMEYKFTIASYQMPLTFVDGSWLPLDLWRQFSRWISNEAPVGGNLWTHFASHEFIGGIGIRNAVAAPVGN